MLPNSTYLTILAEAWNSRPLTPFCRSCEIAWGILAASINLNIIFIRDRNLNAKIRNLSPNFGPRIRIHNCNCGFRLIFLKVAFHLASSFVIYWMTQPSKHLYVLDKTYFELKVKQNIVLYWFFSLLISCCWSNTI